MPNTAPDAMAECRERMETLVAVGVLQRPSDGAILLAQRQARQHLAGMWEFPGGKIEAGEAPTAALRREFMEEVGLHTDRWRPLMEIPWRYAEKSVRLLVFRSSVYAGEPTGREGQKIRWTPLERLRQLNLPPANRGIVSALSLPSRYAITGDFSSPNQLFERVRKVLRQGVTLLQWRAPGLSRSQYVRLGRHLLALSAEAGARLLLNGDPALLHDLPEAAGLQLPARYLTALGSRPVPADKWLGISVHSRAEIERALRLSPDFLALSPVRTTQTHPDRMPLGWMRFQRWAKETPVPVYALGGMREADRALAQSCGGQGIAAIGAWWA